MRKIATIILIAAMASCKEKATEIPGDKTRDKIVNENARPYIIKQLAELDNNVMLARDTTKNTVYREVAIDNIRHSGAEYLDSVTIQNIFSKDFEERLENQKKLIIANLRQIERNKQYTQLVIEQYKK